MISNSVYIQVLFYFGNRSTFKNMKCNSDAVINVQNDFDIFENRFLLKLYLQTSYISDYLNVDRIFNKLLDNDKKMHEKIQSI